MTIVIIYTVINLAETSRHGVHTKWSKIERWNKLLTHDDCFDTAHISYSTNV